MVEATAAQQNRIKKLIDDILPAEHRVLPTVSAGDGCLYITISPGVSSESTVGELSQETLVRAVCWLAARLVIGDIAPVSLIIATNGDSRPPSPSEMAHANTIEVWYRKASRGLPAENRHSLGARFRPVGKYADCLDAFNR